MVGLIHQINRKSKIDGERGLPKLAVPSARILRQGVEGDFNHYRTLMKLNTPKRALLVLPLEIYDRLRDEGWPAVPGDLGENITTVGIPYSSFEIGSVWGIGEAVARISEVCKPCKVLSNLSYVGEARRVEFVKTMVGRRGWYAEVLREGEVSERDLIERIS